MTTATLTTANDTLLDAANQIAPVLRERASDAEKQRTLPDDIVHRLKSAGLFRLGLPATLGGWEADPSTIFHVIEALCRADGSAGWTVLIGNSTTILAWLEPDAARELLDGDADRSSTGVFAPNGRAVPDGSGRSPSTAAGHATAAARHTTFCRPQGYQDPCQWGRCR